MWYITLAALTVALVVGLVVVRNVWHDLKEKDAPPPDPEELLGPLSDAFAAGQMSEEEYARIRESVLRVATSQPVGNPGRGLEGVKAPRRLDMDVRPLSEPTATGDPSDLPA
jgi:hypothetical protein